jgi:hypothetical protein
MGEDRPTREELFDLVWSKPTVQVARALGISDAAVGKLCRKLQVPKPPRGYWAKMAAGRKSRKPALPAYVDEMKTESKPQLSPRGTRLSPKRRQLFLALAEGLRAPEATPSFTLSGEVLTWIDPEYAASLIILAQRELPRILDSEAGSIQQRLARERALRELSELLLPLAAETVAVFKPQAKRTTWYGMDAILVRFTSELRRCVAAMAQLAREHGLSSTARGLDRGDCGWRIRYAGDPEQFVSATAVIHVSPTELWVEAHSAMDDAVFIGERFSLWELIPEDVLGLRFKVLPPVLSRSVAASLSDKLTRLAEAESVHEMARRALDGMEGLPNAATIPAGLSMWLDDTQREAIHTVRESLADLERRMDRWESELELEHARLVEEILDVRPGDIVVASIRGNRARLLVEDVSGFISNEGYLASITGRRFRKDGIPGKRQDTTYVQLSFAEGRRTGA